MVKYNNLNSSEKFELLKMPVNAGKIKENSEKALSEAEKRFPVTSLHNGKGDAFRHCYWSALLTRDIGVSNTKSFTDAHENDPKNPLDEKQMDLHNNSVGMMIGLANKKASDKELADLCEKALKNGRLKVLNP